MVTVGPGVQHALETMPLSVLHQIADTLEAGQPIHTVAQQAQGIQQLWIELSGMPSHEAAIWLRGAVAGYQHALAAQRIEVVWSGPATPAVPIRSTAQAFAELISAAQQQLLLTTYSARPYGPLLVALHAARSRSVEIDIVVETLAGAGSALTGREPAAAFAEIPGVRLWQWPPDRRRTASAKMHAKIAVADRRHLLVSSVNLTESGVENSIEAGVVIRGGHAPQRFAEHIDQLCANGVLVRL